MSNFANNINDMRTVFEATDAVFKVDEENSIFSFTWIGTVSEKSIKKIFTIASSAHSIMEESHWMIDRRKLEGYSPEARIWVKEGFMKFIGKELIAETGKIAAVNSTSPMAQVSSNVLIDAIKKLNPKIDYKEFDMPTPAINWLIGKPKSEEPVKKKKGFFRRNK